MNFIHCPDYNSMSRIAAQEFIKEVNGNPSAWICAATGNSTLGIYREIREYAAAHTGAFSSIGVVKLDEWAGLPNNAANSCENYLLEYLIRPLAIPGTRYISFQGDAWEAVVECRRIEQAIREHGPIDICILGLGTNGHIGFNEPGDSMQPHSHLARLSQESRNHAMLKETGKKPSHGFTLGMADILQSRRIIFLVTGQGKSKILKELQKQEISSRLPASFLWLHPNVSCYLDDSSVAMAGS